MAPTVVAPLLLLALLYAAAPAPTLGADEQYTFPPTDASPYAMERLAFLPASQLKADMGSKAPFPLPPGTVPTEEDPTPTPLTCGHRMPGTAHTVRCSAGPPVGGYVLEPPERATASVVLLHGWTDSPREYANLLRVLLTSAPRAFASTRWVFPYAPRYEEKVEPIPFTPQYAWFDASPLANSGILNMTEVGVTEEFLLNSPAEVDRLGLFFSTRRIEAIVAAERRALRHARRGSGGGGRHPGRVVLAGHSLGAAMATHVALLSRVPLDGVVALQGYLPGARRLTRLPASFHSSPLEYPVMLVAGEADVNVPPVMVRASARILRRLLKGAARVTYTLLPGVTHQSFFAPGPDAQAVVRILRRALE